ncbi:unnamed protein product [Amoebophrya sp. A120]|nr:unnamed protein product [Amoebophrya sp. A120]|eukprot:GSA120T00004967001.1
MASDAVIAVSSLAGHTCGICGHELSGLSTQIAVPFKATEGTTSSSSSAVRYYRPVHTHCLQRVLLCTGRPSEVVKTHLSLASQSEAATGSRKRKRGDDYEDPDTLHVAVFARRQIDASESSNAASANEEENDPQASLGLDTNLLGNAKLTERKQLLPAERRKAEKLRKEQKSRLKAADALCESHSEQYFLVQYVDKITSLVGSGLSMALSSTASSSTSSGSATSSSRTFVCCSRAVDEGEGTGLPCEGCWKFFHSYCAGLGNRIDLQPEEEIGSRNGAAAVLLGLPGTSSSGSTIGSTVTGAKKKGKTVDEAASFQTLVEPILEALCKQQTRLPALDGRHRGKFYCEMCARVRKKRRNVEDLPPAFQKVSQVAAFTPSVELPEVVVSAAASNATNYLARFAAKRRMKQQAAAAPESGNENQENRFELNPVYETDFLGNGTAP